MFETETLPRYKLIKKNYRHKTTATTRTTVLQRVNWPSNLLSVKKIKNVTVSTQNKHLAMPNTVKTQS